MFKIRCSYCKKRLFDIKENMSGAIVIKCCNCKQVNEIDLSEQLMNRKSEQVRIS
ncbi:MAG: hypothetical protein ACERKZ_11265 [Lachnotalea sp.]